MEADDYTDALSYLRRYSQYKRLFGPKTAFIVISGGGNVLYRSCSSQDFVDANQVKCGISISTYAHLDEQFKYMKEKLKDPAIDKNTKRVLADYNNYATRIGLTPDADPEVFRLGSPVTYAPEMKVPVMLLHGVDDPIVPAKGSIDIFRAMRAVGKRAKLVLMPGEGVHGNPDKWKPGPNFALKEAIGVVATLAYACRYLRNRFND
jgi:pimeloyl-ACP methyl ester carboxylesterase